MPAYFDPDDTLVVTFRNHATQNMEKSRREGRPIFDDSEQCEIRVPGMRDWKSFPALSFARWVDDPITGEQTQQTYAERFSRQYQQFKAKQAQTVSGTPLDYAPFLTEGKRAELRALNVYTVEMLAAIDGAPLKNLGANGRDFKNKAIAFIEEARASAPNKQMQAEIDALKARNAVLEEDFAAARNAKQGIRSGEEEFHDMSDQQLKDYISFNTGLEPQGNLPRKTLVRMAVEAIPKEVA